MTKNYFRLFVWSFLALLGVTQSSFAEVVTAQWDWQSNVPSGIREFTALERNTGSLASNVEGIELYVDATNGKFGPNGNNVQFNAGTILHVPVISTKDVVTVTGYQGLSNYCFDGGEALQNTNTYTANSFDVNRGYVEVISTTGGGYLLGVKVEQDKEAAATAFKNFAVDLTNGNLLEDSEKTQWNAVGPFGIAVATDGTISRVAADAANAACVVSGKWHSTNYGWSGLVVTVPVDGPTKITYGLGDFSDNVTVKDAGGNVVGTMNIKGTTYTTGSENVASVNYTGEATTLTISGGSYQTYFALEAVDPTTLVAEATVSFAAGEATGAIVPASQKKEVGKTITLPTNYTMYVEGKTLTGWSDGTTSYAPGASYTVPSADITLVPVFTENTVSLADRTEPVTLKWNFRRDQGAPVVAWQNTNGNIWVTQATINNETIDVPMIVNTNPGKFNNSNNTDWIQANNGTIFTIPSCKGATVSMEAYNVITTTTIDGQNDYTQAKTISYEIANTTDNIDIVIGDGSYYRYVQVVLPVVAQTGGKTYDNETATVVWKMTDTTNPGDNTATPQEVFSTIAFDYGTATITGTSSITNETAASVTTGIKFKPANGASDLLKWNVKPAAGLTFTPTKLSGYVNRCGTDAENGITVSVYVEGASEATKLGTWTALRSGKTSAQKPYDATAIYKYEIELTEDQQNALTSADGFYLTSTIGVGNAKEGAFGEVTIEGKINGTAANVNKYTLNIAPNEEVAGSVSAYPVSETYEEGTEVRLTATEKFGYDFVNWTNAAGEVLSTEPVFALTVTADSTVTANFAQVNTYELKLNVDGTNDYMVKINPAPTVVDGKYMYEEGTAVQLTADQYDGLVIFTNWSDGETNSSKLVSMTEDIDITAYYAENDIIAGWDFYKAGNNGRKADFAALDNDADALNLQNTSTGETSGWLDKSTIAGGGYESFTGAAVNWRTGASNGDVGNWHWQTKVNAEAFKNINVQFQMLYNYNAYQTYNVEYSLDGETWKNAGSVTMSGAKQAAAFNETLPEACNNQANLYIRMLADKENSSVDGSASANDGNTLAMFFITGTPELVNDGTAPALVSTVPTNGATGVSATGKIVLTFDERVKTADSFVPTADLNGQSLTPVVSGKTVTFSYKGLEYSKEYTFTLPAGSIGDLTDNYLNEPVTLTFTTMTRPAVSKQMYDAVVSNVDELLAALSAAQSRSDKNVRYRIFVKNGEYTIPLKGTMKSGADNPDGSGKFEVEECITFINTQNLSLVGESRDGVIITNDIPAEATFTGKYGLTSKYDGIGNSDVFQISGSDYYFQDLTIESGMQDATGRDLAVHDKSTRTIYKNTALRGFQDTWTSNNGNGIFYFEGGYLRGRTDYMCGKGDAYFNGVELRQIAGGYAAVPSTPKSIGWVYKDCVINGETAVVDAATQTIATAESANGNYTLGRPWGSGTPVAVFIDTKMNVVPSAIGWNEMSGGWPARFAEFNSTTSTGSVIDLSGRKTTFGDGHANNPVLTAEEALYYGNMSNMFGDWDPTLLTEQAPAVKNVVLDGNTLTWDDSDYALLYAIVEDGNVVAFTTENSFDISTLSSTSLHSAKAAGASANATAPVWAVRAANEMGGLNEAVEATQADAVSEVKAEEVVKASNGKIYNVAGQEVSASYKGIVIIDGKKVIK